mmetsp:Transcript_108985/g.308289  ORF Transcript_108985/g.308289 Transcript_108985/m.308289 type:complete len:215 (-) Transcript_108985:379-1023(-)
MAERINLLPLLGFLPALVRGAQRHVVRGRHVLREELRAVRLPGLQPLGIGEGRGERRPVRERRRNRQHRVDAAEQGRQEHHLPEAQVAGQPGQALAYGGGDVPGVVVGAPARRVRRPDALLDRAGGLQRRQRLVDARGRGGVQRVVEAARLQAGAEDREHQLHQGAAEDLGRGHRVEPKIEASLREEAEGEARAHAAGATAPLHHLGLGHELLL